MKTLEECKHDAAVRHGYADYYQIQMTDDEPWDRNEIELDILKEASQDFENQFNPIFCKQHERRNNPQPSA